MVMLVMTWLYKTRLTLCRPWWRLSEQQSWYRDRRPERPAPRHQQGSVKAVSLQRDADCSGWSPRATRFRRLERSRRWPAWAHVGASRVVLMWRLEG